MTRWLIRILLLLAAAAVGFWLFWSSPEKIIRKRLQQLAELVSFTSKEGALAKAYNSQKLADFFTPDVEVKVDVPGGLQRTFQGRQELMESALAARNTLTALKVEFLDANVTVSADKQSASVDLTARASASGERDTMVQELKFGFRKVGRDWLIDSAETVKTLR